MLSYIRTGVLISLSAFGDVIGEDTMEFLMVPVEQFFDGQGGRLTDAAKCDVICIYSSVNRTISNI